VFGNTVSRFGLTDAQGRMAVAVPVPPLLSRGAVLYTQAALLDPLTGALDMTRGARIPSATDRLIRRGSAVRLALQVRRAVNAAEVDASLSDGEKCALLSTSTRGAP
jgi:hypothetical protein